MRALQQTAHYSIGQFSWVLRGAKAHRHRATRRNGVFLRELAASSKTRSIVKMLEVGSRVYAEEEEWSGRPGPRWQRSRAATLPPGLLLQCSEAYFTLHTAGETCHSTSAISTH